MDGLFGNTSGNSALILGTDVITQPDNYYGQMTMNNRGEQRIAQAIPERAECVRFGRSWGAAIPTANAFTYVAAWPTTRAEIALYNGEASGGATYIIDRVWMANITSMAAAQPATILAQNVPSDAITAAPTDNAAIIKHNLSGKRTSYTGSGRLAIAGTTFGAIANRWAALVGTAAAMTTNLGLAVSIDVYGRYLVPPGGLFNLAGLAGTAAGTAIIGLEWHELQLTLK